ncbi:hypothetical protein ABMA70_00385 [Halobacteriovorax sp. XZX-3]|uniref:hypothetical protein n=1 Tax=unclassified Halobacteriovorax TaxID=2639665 RepID=UPI00371191D0
MNKIIISLFSLLLSKFIYAGALTSVNNDTCWYKEDEGRTKIASFNDQVSINTNRDEILGHVVKYLHEQKFAADKIDMIHSFGLCGPRLSLAFRISYDKVDYCLRANVNKNTELTFSGVGLAQDSKGACQSIASDKLIVSIDQKNIVDLQKLLGEQGMSPKKVDKLSSKVYVLYFNVERDEIKDVRKSIVTSNLVNSAEYSTGQYHIADEFELLSISYFRK